MMTGWNGCAKSAAKMAAKFDHDPRKAAAHYQKMQRRYASRLYRRDHEVTAK
jgi:hypothetical protein